MANKKDSLGDRMKGNYESVTKTKLVKRMPVAIRIDGKAFHTFTRGFNKPYDLVLSKAMELTTQKLCENIQGCVFGYTQSDEITLILVDYKTLDTSAWFDNEVQKMCSISASMATMWFAKMFALSAECFRNKMEIRAYEDNGVIFDELYFPDDVLKEYGIKDNETAQKLLNKYTDAISKGAMFDSRVFNIPKEEVCNLLIWRQQDATRNSIEMLGRAYFSDKELFKKNCSNIQDMLMKQHGVNWNNIPTRFKRGLCCARAVNEFPCIENHRHWFVDENIPIFTQDRDYVEKYILIPKENEE